MKKKIAILFLAAFGYAGYASAQVLLVANKSHCPETVIIYAHEPGFPCGSLVSNPIPVAAGRAIPAFAPPAINDASCGIPGSVGVGWVGGACASASAVFDGGDVAGISVGNSTCYPLPLATGPGCAGFPSLIAGWDITHAPNIEMFFHN